MKYWDWQPWLAPQWKTLGGEVFQWKPILEQVELFKENQGVDKSETMLYLDKVVSESASLDEDEEALALVSKQIKLPWLLSAGGLDECRE